MRLEIFLDPEAGIHCDHLLVWDFALGAGDLCWIKPFALEQWPMVTGAPVAPSDGELVPVEVVFMLLFVFADVEEKLVLSTRLQV